MGTMGVMRAAVVLVLVHLLLVDVQSAGTVSSKQHQILMNVLDGMTSVHPSAKQGVSPVLEAMRQIDAEEIPGFLLTDHVQDVFKRMLKSSLDPLKMRDVVDKAEQFCMRHSQEIDILIRCGILNQTVIAGCDPAPLLEKLLHQFYLEHPSIDIASTPPSPSVHHPSFLTGYGSRPAAPTSTQWRTWDRSQLHV